VVAHDILAEGTEISRNLRELSVSLRNNAERLLRDVGLTHGAMTARLDQISSGTDTEVEESAPTRGRQKRGRRKQGQERSNEDLDVPEFLPRG